VNRTAASPARERRLRERPLPDDVTARRAGFLIAAVTLLVAIAGGMLMRLVDPRDFPSIGAGLWWAVQTITTVGYGDTVPGTTGGRALAAVVMVTGLGFLSVVTAAISAAFVESARRRRRRSEELTLEHIAQRLDEIERRLSERQP
jgi:voltage-gated potassium channel